MRDRSREILSRGELTLRAESGGERLGIHAQVAKEREILFEALVVVV